MTTAIAWFPTVGACVGVVVGGIAAGLGSFAPMPVAAAVAVLGGVIVTGAFHEDGLADTADAITGGWTTEQRLKILDDPLHGSYGVAALCGSIILRVTSLSTMSLPVAFAAAVSAHALARAAAVVMMGIYPVARPSGLGADYARMTSPTTVLFGCVSGIGVVLLVTGWWAAVLIAVAIPCVVLVGKMSRRALGGITGDVLGATEQVTECALFVAVSALATHSHLWWA